MNTYHNSLEVELTSKCTLQCPACSRTSTHDDHKPEWNAGDMPVDLVKRLCDTSDYNRYLFVGCYGDVIYHKDFIEICDYYIKANKKLMIHTNGSGKPQAWWDKLAKLEWKQRHIFCFSIDGLEDTNHLYRVNAKWDTIMRGINTLANAENRPYLVWKFIKFPYNEHQVEQARQLSQELGFDEFDIVESLRNKKLYQHTGKEELYVW